MILGIVGISPNALKECFRMGHSTNPSYIPNSEDAAGEQGAGDDIH